MKVQFFNSGISLSSVNTWKVLKPRAAACQKWSASNPTCAQSPLPTFSWECQSRGVSLKLSFLPSSHLLWFTWHSRGKAGFWPGFLSYKEGKPLKALLNNVHKLPKILSVPNAKSLPHGWTFLLGLLRRSVNDRIKKKNHHLNATSRQEWQCHGKVGGLTPTLGWEMPHGASVSMWRRAVVSEASGGHPKVVWLTLGTPLLCCDLVAFSMETLVIVVLYFHFKAY